MAFHVACPITCRKICYCELGFRGELRSAKARSEFLEEVVRVDRFLKDPWLIKARGGNATVQVSVPKVVVAAVAPTTVVASSAQVKRPALQKHASVAVVENNAKKFESGGLASPAADNAVEEQGHSNSKLLCRLCFNGENEGSERARKMLSCNCCGKKYHRSCVKAWSQNRDLFHWSSWTCPSCRTCEVCRQTGDPNKFVFCKRCDAAYHCYCQQPPHKNVGHGPYLCPKHTKCHSCDSSVPGNGLSVRWFLGHTCCDACGRLFVKNNYCPVCLKVYRDSESTPMVCCDICQKWVHCSCDGISDAKYDEFQVDENLQYVCPTCRGEGCQIRSLDEAVQELWRRRDAADRDLIASLRAAAGLPTQEEIFDISPFSDDEDGDPVFPSKEYGRSLKFSLKGIDDNSPRKSKEYGKRSSKKKSGKKKRDKTPLNSKTLAHHGSTLGFNTGDGKNEERQFPGGPVTSSPTVNVTEGKCAVNEAAVSKHKDVEEVTATYQTKLSRHMIKSNHPEDLSNKEETGTLGSMPKTGKGPKLVIHLGGGSRNSTSPRSEASSFRRGRDLTSSNGTENGNQLKLVRPGTATKFEDQKGNKMDPCQWKASRLREIDSRSIKLKKAEPEASNINSKVSGEESADGYESIAPKKTRSLLGKRALENIGSARSGSEVSASRKNKYSSVEYAEDRPTASGDLIDDNSRIVSSSQAFEKDHKPSLKFKISKSSNSGNQSASTNLNAESQISLPLLGNNAITYARGQRSKRKRPAQDDDDAPQKFEDNTMKDFSDANWILQKLGKDAAGKRVEIHQASSNSWHRGTVIEVFEGTSIVSISLDDGKAKTFELGKQGIRFVSQKQKR